MTETFHLTAEQAWAYERIFVPAFFADWAPRVVDAAAIVADDHVLDVACGTGVVAREAASRIGADHVVGLDLNPAMLDVARELMADATWQIGDATELPFENERFTVVLCQAGIIFFSDPDRALGEMSRVLTPGGRLVIQTWDGLWAQPGYGPFVDIVAHHGGPATMPLLSTYWGHGDRDALAGCVEAQGLQVTAVRTRLGTAHFPDVETFLDAEVAGTPLADLLDADAVQRIAADTRAAFEPYTLPDGRLELPLSGHILTALKPG